MQLQASPGSLTPSMGLWMNLRLGSGRPFLRLNTSTQVYSSTPGQRKKRAALYPWFNLPSLSCNDPNESWCSSSIYFHLVSSIFIYFHLFSTCQFYQWPKWDRHQHGMILKKWVAHGPLEPSCWASLTWDFGRQSLRQCGPDHRGDTWGIDKLDHLLNGNSRILNRRYVSTIFGHILWGYSLKLRPEE